MPRTLREATRAKMSRAQKKRFAEGRSNILEIGKTFEFGNTVWQKRRAPWNKGKCGYSNPGATGKPRPWMRAQNHWNWQGGKSARRMNEVEYVNWRKAVFMRDKYTCQFCGTTKSGQLQADHLMPYALFPAVRYDVNNGQTLCAACHRKTSSYGIKINIFKRTLEAMEIWLGAPRAAVAPGSTPNASSAST